MRKFAFFVFITLFTATFLSLAQDDKLEEYKFETEDAQPETSSYFSVAGGYTVTFNMIKLDDLNNLATKTFYMPELKTPIITSGFEISTGAIIVKNLNVGYFNFTGNTTSSMDTANLSRSFDYKIDGSGFIIDYGFVPFKSFAVLPGLQVGFVKSTINISQSQKNVDWNKIGPNQLTDNYSHTFEKAFINLEPRVSVEYAVTNFLMFRANISYAMSMNNPFSSADWQYNNNAATLNVPDKINQSGLKFQLGLFVGLMNF